MRITFMELLKTADVRPGANIFFYRDQNGVEIDFIVEFNNRLYFIEAKAGERIDEKKLNFKKVIPLFEGKHETRAIIMQNITEPGIIKKKDYLFLNPLISDIALW